MAASPSLRKVISSLLRHTQLSAPQPAEIASRQQNIIGDFLISLGQGFEKLQHSTPGTYADEAADRSGTEGMSPCYETLLPESHSTNK